MLNIIKRSKNCVIIELSGTIDAIDMRVGLDELFKLSEDISHGHMIYKISDFSFPTLGAIGVEMARLPSMFRLLGKYDKCALLCDTAWIRTAAEIEGALFPGIVIKSFEFNADDQADAWLNTQQ
jgi:hypothetical protein